MQDEPASKFVEELDHNNEAALAAILCLRLKLSRNEGRLLARLLLHECSTRGDLCAAVASGTRSIAPGSFGPLLLALRRKLAVHGVGIDNVYGVGYALAKNARKRIHKLLAKHDAERARLKFEDELDVRISRAVLLENQ